MRRLASVTLAVLTLSVGGCEVLAPLNPVRLHLKGPTHAPGTLDADLPRVYSDIYGEDADGGHTCEFPLVLEVSGGEKFHSEVEWSGAVVRVHDAAGALRVAYPVSREHLTTIIGTQSLRSGESRTFDLHVRSQAMPFLALIEIGGLSVDDGRTVVRAVQVECRLS